MTRFIRGLLFVTVAATTVPAAAAQIPMASGFGEANIGGQRVYVHVTVAVPPGIERARAVADGIRGMGARPIDSAEFSLTGMDWDGHSAGTFGSGLTQNYSSAMTDVEIAALTNTHDTWYGVVTSVFGFVKGESTERCPSLARECPGPQYLDAKNDVAFIAIGGCCTLAATWYVTSGTPEADVVINNRFNWNSPSLDLETVLLHENGHALGLGHSQAPDAVMAAAYTEQRRALSEDDERGITYVYPAVGALGSVTGQVTDAQSSAISGATVSIGNLPGGTVATNGSGVYWIHDVPKIGMYTVVASAENYESNSKLVSISGDVNTLDFTLSGGNGNGGGGNGGGCKKAGPKAC